MNKNWKNLMLIQLQGAWKKSQFLSDVCLFIVLYRTIYNLQITVCRCAEKQHGLVNLGDIWGYEQLFNMVVEKILRFVSFFFFLIGS